VELGKYLGRAVLDEVTLLATVLAFDIAAAATGSARLRAVADVVALVVAVGAGNLGLLDDLLFFGAGLHGVTDLLAVRAVWLQAVHGEASIVQTLKVLLRALGPAFGKDGATRLKTLLEGDLILLVSVALEVDVGVDLRRDSLLLGNEVVLEAGLAEALLKLKDGELRGELGVDPEGLDEVVGIASVIGGKEVVPSVVGVVNLRKANGVDVVLLSTSGGTVASTGALLADSVSTLRRAVTFSTASATGASESALGTGVSTVGLVVSSFTAVEALAGVLAGLRTLAREMTRLATAVGMLVMRMEVHCRGDSLAAGVITRATSVLGDGLRVHARVVCVDASGGSVFDPLSGIGASGRLFPAGSYRWC